jgi:hypothetical protein
VPRRPGHAPSGRRRRRGLRPRSGLGLVGCPAAAGDRGARHRERVGGRRPRARRHAPDYKDLTIYVYGVGELTTTEPSIFARPDGDDPYPAGTSVEATVYVLSNASQRRLDLTDLSADYSSYGNDLAQQDTFAGQDLLTQQGWSTELSTQFPADATSWYLLPGEQVVFGNAWFHRPSDGPLTLQFLWPAERIFLGANVQF